MAVLAAVDATAAIEKAIAAFGTNADAPFEAAVTNEFETLSAFKRTLASKLTNGSVLVTRVRMSATFEQSPRTSASRNAFEAYEPS